MALIRTVDFISDRIMGDFCNIRMAVPARNISVRGIVINIFIDIITLFSSLFVDPTDLTVLVSHQAVFFVRCLYLKCSQ